MKKLFTSLLVLVSLLSFGQNSTLTHLLIGDSADRAYDMFQNTSGDYFLLSSTNSYGSGKQDIQVTKTDAVGDVSWSYTYGTSGDDIGLKMKPTSDGGAIIVGHSDGFGGTSGQDAVILKITSTGTVSWVRAIRGVYVDAAHDAVQTTNGDIYVTGFAELDSFNNNIFLARYNSSGTLFFVRSYGGAGNDEGYGIAQGKDGNLLIVGSTANDSVNIGGTGDRDIKLLEVNTGGGIINSKNYGSTADEFALTVIATSDYKYIVAGNTQSGGGGSTDIFTLEVDTNFNVSNSYWYGGVDNETVSSINLAPNNDLTVAGSITGTMSPQDILLFRGSRSGNVNVTAVYGGMGSDANYGVGLAGSNLNGYSIFASGQSFNMMNNENSYLVKVADDLSSFCIDGLENVQSGALSLSSGLFSYTFNLGQNFNQSLTRTSVTTSDSTLCCRLDAQVAADSVRICDGESTNLGRSAISGYSYSWTANNSTWTSTSANPTVSPSATTIYKLVVTSSNSTCTIDSSYITVNVNPLQTVPMVPDTFFCTGDSVTLVAPSGFNSYSWTGGGNSFSGQNLKVFSENTFILTLIDNNSCVYSDTVFADEKPIPTFSLGPDSTICDNDTITLFGPVGMAEYVWNGTSTTNGVYKTNTSQTVTCRAITSFGCEYTDQVQILNKPSSPLFIGNDTSFCEGESYTINAPGALVGFLWQDTIASGASLTTQDAGTYWVQAYNSFNCYSYDTIVLSHIAAPVFSLGNDTGFCDVVNYTLLGPNGVSDYLWFNGTTNQTYTVTGEGNYYLDVENAAGCKWSDSVYVSVYTSPTIDLGPDTFVCKSTPLNLSPGSGFSSYVWNTSATSEFISVTTMGTYSVTVIDMNGCSAADTIVVDSCPVSVQDIAGITYSIFPNPASSSFTLTSSGNIVDYQMYMTNIEGKMVRELTLKSNINTIDVSDLSDGIYYIKLVSDNKSIPFKVTIHQ